MKKQNIVLAILKIKELKRILDEKRAIEKVMSNERM